MVAVGFQSFFFLTRPHPFFVVVATLAELSGFILEVVPIEDCVKGAVEDCAPFLCMKKNVTATAAITTIAATYTHNSVMT